MDSAEANYSCVQPWVSNVCDTGYVFTAFIALDLDRVDVWSVWGVSIELLPSFDRSLFQFLLGAYNVEPATLTLPDW